MILEKIGLKVNRIFLKITNLNFVKVYPRHSIRFARTYFKDKEIDVVEIGTDQGENAENMLKVLNINKLYCIDPYLSYDLYLENRTKKTLNKAEKIAERKLKSKIIWIKKYSNDAVEDIPEKVDLVYIEGNHSYDYVKQDIENYWKVLKDGGILAGHDITNDFFGGDILLAVAEFCIKNKLKPYTSRTDWWIIK